MLAVVPTYEDASEALHGTLYGSTFHLGIFQPGVQIAGEDSVEHHLCQNFTMLFWIQGLAINELNKMLTHQFKLDEIESLRATCEAEAVEAMGSALHIKDNK